MSERNQSTEEHPYRRVAYKAHRVMMTRVIPSLYTLFVPWAFLVGWAMYGATFIDPAGKDDRMGIVVLNLLLLIIGTISFFIVRSEDVKRPSYSERIFIATMLATPIGLITRFMMTHLW